MQCISPFVYPCTVLHGSWMDYRHIGYYDQVQLATDACKIEYGSVPNLCNDHHSFNTFWVFVLISQRRMWWYFFHIWNSYQVRCIAHVCKITFGSMPNLSNYGHFFIHLGYILWLILFIFGTIIRYMYHVLLVMVKSHLVCHIGVIMAIYVLKLYVFVAISRNRMGWCCSYLVR